MGFLAPRKFQPPGGVRAHGGCLGQPRVGRGAARGRSGLPEEIKRDKLFNEFGNRASFDAPFWCWAYSWAIRRAGVDGFAGRHRGAAMKYPSPWHPVQAPRHGERTDTKQQDPVEAVPGWRRLAALVDTDSTVLNGFRSVQDSARRSNVETTARESEEVLRRISVKAG
jgi:hypothetical protein